MRNIIGFTALVLMLSACASSQGGGRDNRPEQFAKNPSVVLALDIAQSREAQEKGAHAALRETASDAAITFAPEPVAAKEWLNAQPSPANAKWQPHAVYLSCDGKTGVTTGAYQQGDTNGYYTTVWQYHQKRNGEGKGKWFWVLSHGDSLEIPREAPEFLQTKSASCKGKAPATLMAPDEGVQMKQGLSRDQTLSYTWQYRPDKSRSLVVKIWDGEKSIPVLTDVVAAPAN